MLDMSWGEVMVIGGVALIVIGPKDLPKALRTVGQLTGKVRRMAGEFHTQFNDAMREADLNDVRKDFESMNRDVMSTTPSFNPIQTIRDELKGSVDGKVPAASAAIAVGDYHAPAAPSPGPEVVPAPSAGDPFVVEEVGAPPAITPVAVPDHHGAGSAMPMEVAGPGLEQLAPPRVSESSPGERT